MITGIDHLIILVDDLELGMQQYRDLGFTVTPGGRHPYGTHNGLVTFADGSYLELIAFYDPDAVNHQWHRHLSTGGGLIDHALGCDDLDDAIESAQRRGLTLDGPSDGARERPDGIAIAWRTARPKDPASTGLPFLIEDVSERSFRVPGGAAAVHTNGVTGIDRLVVAVGDLDRVTGQYARLIGIEPVSTDAGDAVKAARLAVGPHTVELQQPARDTEMERQIATRGDGPFAAIFYGTEVLTLDPASAGDARLSVITR